MRRPRGGFRVKLMKFHLLGPLLICAAFKDLLPNLKLKFYIIFFKEGFQNISVGLCSSSDPPILMLYSLCGFLVGYLLDVTSLSSLSPRTLGPSVQFPLLDKSMSFSALPQKVRTQHPVHFLSL